MHSPKAKTQAFDYADAHDDEHLLPKENGYSGSDDGFELMFQADLQNFLLVEKAISGLSDMWINVSKRIREMINLNDVKISHVS